MFALISQWESGNENRETFCNRHRITVATFSYWRTKYLKEKNQAPTPQFIELQPQVTNTLEIIYPNGVIVKLAQNSPVSDLQTMIQLI